MDLSVMRYVAHTLICVWRIARENPAWLGLIYSSLAWLDLVKYQICTSLFSVHPCKQSIFYGTPWTVCVPVRICYWRYEMFEEFHKTFGHYRCESIKSKLLWILGRFTFRNQLDVRNLQRVR